MKFKEGLIYRDSDQNGTKDPERDWRAGMRDPSGVSLSTSEVFLVLVWIVVIDRYKNS